MQVCCPLDEEKKNNDSNVFPDSHPKPKCHMRDYGRKIISAFPSVACYRKNFEIDKNKI